MYVSLEALGLKFSYRKSVPSSQSSFQIFHSLFQDDIGEVGGGGGGGGGEGGRGGDFP